MLTACRPSVDELVTVENAKPRQAHSDLRLSPSQSLRSGGRSIRSGSGRFSSHCSSFSPSSSIDVLGARTNQTDLWVKGPRDLLFSLQPWAYGELGACAYMLRSAHYFIYQRSFDVRRKPEYFNRILLGAISGGAIILFVTNLTNDDGSSINLGAAALGFVAGYSADFLFNTIERIVTAIFPKVAVETVPANSSMARTAPKRTTPPPTPAPGSGSADERGARSRTASSEREQHR